MKRTPLRRKQYQLKRKRKPKKRRVHSELVRLDKKLWILFSMYIRKRDKWTCVTCGAKPENHQQVHAGHFVSRGNKSVKFDPKNVHAQCATCNLFRQGNVAAYSGFVVNTYGVEELHRILGDAKFIKQWTESELKELIRVLQEEPKTYEKVYYKLTNKNA